MLHRPYMMRSADSFRKIEQPTENNAQRFCVSRNQSADSTTSNWILTDSSNSRCPKLSSSLLPRSTRSCYLASSDVDIWFLYRTRTVPFIMGVCFRFVAVLLSSKESSRPIKYVCIILGFICVLFVIYVASSKHVEKRTPYKWFTLHLFGQHLAQLVISTLLEIDVALGSQR